MQRELPASVSAGPTSSIGASDTSIKSDCPGIALVTLPTGPNAMPDYSVSECIATGRKTLEALDEQATRCEALLQSQQARIRELEANVTHQHASFGDLQGRLDKCHAHTRSLENENLRRAAEIVGLKAEKSELVEFNRSLLRQATCFRDGLMVIISDLDKLAEGKTGHEAWNQVCVHCMSQILACHADVSEATTNFAYVVPRRT